MSIIYNMSANAVNGFVKLYSRFLSEKSHRKFSRFVKGQRDIMDTIAREMADIDRSAPTIWVHCASLGEYGVARPLITEMKRRMKCNIVLTFFSPSGYEALGASHPDIDRLFYLPIDTRRQARRFIDLVKPDRAVFMISEFWPNYLAQLKSNAIPTFLVSAIIRDNSQFFKWYGRTYRKLLSSFSHIFVLNNGSKFNLSMLGYDDVSIIGDALFDNASLVASTPWHDAIIERFTSFSPTFIAGSISDHNDRRLIKALMDKNPDTRFILVPHDIREDEIERLTAFDPTRTVRYTRADQFTDLQSARVLIIDCMGKLAYLYRYGTWAYVGGGFTPLLHSVIEATVYGLPVAFGPRIERKVTPQQLQNLGIGAITETPEQICQWFEDLKDNPERLKEIKQKASDYVARNEGATDVIVSRITRGLK
ncbi:MAG: 3-deoxy-D-manno-octulosonic acid transferase [Bacteroides sp.]|nr:3-deoxy-D-manno-octulosonic acid transferase [Bacteroides sp.]MCM1413500.1 3-deoxy-D-manno-octulosonic acid transferase [Bacteroides sp.]MCM1471054.1 3-deoxy-D-manno-octulosonic acid transferase [Bacteroides sp.]